MGTRLLSWEFQEICPWMEELSYLRRENMLLCSENKLAQRELTLRAIPPVRHD
jgi:hypothetical protein